MCTQWEIGLILNIWFTCKSGSYHALFTHTLPIKSKIGGKILSQKHAKNKLSSPLFNSVKFSLRSKNEWEALVAFKLSVALNTWKRKAGFISKANSKSVCFKVILQA